MSRHAPETRRYAPNGGISGPKLTVMHRMAGKWGLE